MLETFALYGLVFVLAATPMVELLVVIPLGLSFGLDPVVVALLAFAGNALPIWAIVVLWRWYVARRGLPRRRWGDRAQRVWDRFGLPGLALSAPLITGIHLAAIMALMLHAPRRNVATWLVASLVGWTLATTLVAVYGFGLLGF